MKPTTHYGISIPEYGDHTRLYDHFDTHLPQIDTALNAISQKIAAQEIVIPLESPYGGNATAILSGDIVTLRGHFTRIGYAGIEKMGQLPLGFRPPAGPDLRVRVIAGTASENVTGMRVCVINSSGAVQIVGEGDTTTFHVTGLTFRRAQP